MENINIAKKESLVESAVAVLELLGGCIVLLAMMLGTMCAVAYPVLWAIGQF